MGTNYYLHDINVTPGPCPHCKRPYEQAEALHIGKSSAGWCFTLHVHPERGINTLADWLEEWRKPGMVIRDEYGQDVSIKEMVESVTERSWGPSRASYGSARFYSGNHAEPGPRNLLRHCIESGFCVGHGEGTWDYCVGNFS